MTIVTTCRRKQRRHATLGNDQISVELTWPQPSGTRHCFPLADVSISGLSFVFEDELPGVESGTSIPTAMMRLGDCEIQGDLVVMHLTPQSENRQVCGALFYAATDEDLLKWRAAMAGIEAVR